MDRLALALTVVTLVVAACGSGTRTEVRTNNGGILDCESEIVEYAQFDYGPDAPGSASPAESLTMLTADQRIPGSPQMESEAEDAVVFAYSDVQQSSRPGTDHSFE